MWKSRECRLFQFDFHAFHDKDFTTWLVSSLWWLWCTYFARKIILQKRKTVSPVFVEYVLVMGDGQISHSYLVCSNCPYSKRRQLTLNQWTVHLYVLWNVVLRKYAAQAVKASHQSVMAWRYLQVHKKKKILVTFSCNCMSTWIQYGIKVLYQDVYFVGW